MRVGLLRPKSVRDSVERCRKKLEADRAGGGVEPSVPGGENKIICRKHAGGSEVQRVQATQLVLDCERAGVLDQALIDFDDRESRPLFACGLRGSSSPREPDGADSLYVPHPTHEPGVGARHRVANKLALRLPDVAFDERARVEVEVQRSASRSARTSADALSRLLTSRGERELIASYVSHLNSCRYCEAIHSAYAAVQLDDDWELVEAAKNDPGTAPISSKLKSLLALAAQVQAGGQNVDEAHVAAAREQGATDVEIHDTVLIAAAFCMYNRYVDGLDTWTQSDRPQAFLPRARALAQGGYLAPVDYAQYTAES